MDIPLLVRQILGTLEDGVFCLTPRNGAFDLVYSSSSTGTSGVCVNASTIASTSIGSGLVVNSYLYFISLTRT